MGRLRRGSFQTSDVGLQLVKDDWVDSMGLVRIGAGLVSLASLLLFLLRLLLLLLHSP